jgi:hypothetical protein
LETGRVDLEGRVTGSAMDVGGRMSLSVGRFGPGRAVVVAFAVLLLSAGTVAAKPVEARAFGSGASGAMIKTGSATEMQVGEVTRTATSFSISMKTVYQVALYLDETGARQALAPFKGQPLKELLKKDELHRAILDGGFPKAIVLSFVQDTSAQAVRTKLEDSLALSPAYGTPEARRLLGFIEGTFKAEDEVVILILADRVLTTVANKVRPEILGQAFPRALLAAWVGAKKKSGEASGLLADIGPWLE